MGVTVGAIVCAGDAVGTVEGVAVAEGEAFVALALTTVGVRVAGSASPTALAAARAPASIVA